MRNKMKEQERVFDAKLDVLNKKVQMQLKEIAQLTKSQKRTERIERKENAKIQIEKDNNNSSGTESPVIN